MRNVARQSLRGALFGAAAMALAMGASHHASAQSIEASDLVPAPDGTNLLLGYYTYNHYDSDHSPSGKVSASVNGNLFIERYVHYSYLGNTPAGFQFLALNGWNTGTVGGASANTGGELEAIVSGFIWPGANTATKTYPFVGFYLYPPINSAGYGSNAWAGSLQLGIDKGFGDNFSIDADEYTTFSGESTAGSVRTTTDPSYTLQVWFNWNWTPQLETSIGWQSNFGGEGTSVNALTGTGTVNPGSQREEIRGWVSYFFLPNLQGGLEINHDFVDVNNLKNEFGLLARVLYVF
jgi:hypothetical protein